MKWLATVILTGLALSAGAAEASPIVHAHRGGALTDGVPTLPENSLAAFERAGRAGFVIELDVNPPW